MAFFYTPFPRLLEWGIKAGGGKCATTTNGKCLKGWREIAVVAHGAAVASSISDNEGRHLLAKDLLKLMQKQGLGDATKVIYMHMCNSGGSEFEKAFGKELKADEKLKGIEVIGYAGKVGRLPGVGPAIEPRGYSAGRNGHRYARVVPPPKKGGR